MRKLIWRNLRPARAYHKAIPREDERIGDKCARESNKQMLPAVIVLVNRNAVLLGNGKRHGRKRDVARNRLRRKRWQSTQQRRNGSTKRHFETHSAIIAPCALLCHTPARGMSFASAQAVAADDALSASLHVNSATLCTSAARALRCGRQNQVTRLPLRLRCRRRQCLARSQGRSRFRGRAHQGSPSAR